jgi:hypothetical protein
MPLLRCTEEECGHEWFERSRLATNADCPECGEASELVGVDDEPPGELHRVSSRPLGEHAHPGWAREKAREVLRDRGIGLPPVVVHSIARKCGFEVRESNKLGSLSARLVGNVIEVSVGDPAVRQRFSVAHELGHHFLGSGHGDGPLAEQEANAFAGELLVPGPVLRTAMERVTDTRELAQLFKVSRQVLEVAAEHHKLSGRLT